jgi:hypothetical protein
MRVESRDLQSKKGADVQSTGEMNHFHLRLSNDTVAGPAGPAINKREVQGRAVSARRVSITRVFRNASRAVAARKIFVGCQP